MSGKRIWPKALLTLGALMASSYWFMPGLYLEPMLKVNRALAGLSAHQVQVGDHTIHYLEGGKGGPTVVLLHGIFAEKDHWVDFARHVRKHAHVIIPDLPGFGASTRLDQGIYHYAEQSQRIRDFLQLLALEDVHLAGNSMGGAIAARFALDNPDKVRSIAFIGAPHGIKSPIASDMEGRLSKGEIPLVAKNRAEFEALLSFLFVEVPWLPRPVYEHSLDHAVSRVESNSRIWAQQESDPFRLDDHLENLEASGTPILTLWGEQEQVFHVSGIEVMRERLPSGRHHVMQQTGHLPMMEHPARTAGFYRDFLLANPAR